MRWDHPRVCGEQAVIGNQAVHFEGSSPRVRGADVLGPHAAL